MPQFLTDFRYFLSRYKSYWNSMLNDTYNKFNNISEEALEEYESNHFINTLFFEVTNICNAKCIFCAYKKINEEKDRKKGIMSFEIFKRAIDEYKMLGGKTVSFTPTIGEPLIDPGLIEKIDYAVNKATIEKVYFYSNGILLNKNELYKKLIDSGIHEIHISIPDCDKEVFEKVFGVSLYDEMIIGLNSLLAYNKKKGEPVEIFIDFRPARFPVKIITSLDFIRYIKPFLSNKVKYTFMADYDNWSGNLEKKDLIGIMKLRRMPKSFKIACMRTFDASILFDGSLRLCACRVKTTEFDELVVGDINKNSLKEIYYGEKAKQVRKKFLKNDVPGVCINCSMYIPAALPFKLKP